MSTKRPQEDQGEQRDYKGSTSQRRKMAADLFFSVPAQALAFSLFPFLSSDDLLSLRATCSIMFKVINEESESEAIWKHALTRDYSLTESDGLQTLRLRKSKKEERLPVFGYKAGEAITKAPSAFVSWKTWRKASLYYFRGSEKVIQNLNGSYFLRCAKLWSKIERWFESPKSRDVGRRIRTSLNSGMKYSDWGPALQNANHTVGLQASQAIFSFYGGQEHRDIPESLADMFNGLLGGSNAYDTYSSTILCPPYPIKPSPQHPVSYVAIARCPYSPNQGHHKVFVVDIITGELCLVSSSQLVTVVDSGPDSALLWLEEYASRLDYGTIGIGPMGDDISELLAIVLYPQILPKSPPTKDIQVVSRAVTRGVEVIASAVYTPHLASGGIGFIYSFRIRLLTQEDGDDYAPSNERGFETCQLRSRHWEITSDDTGEIDFVEGDGVIGMYPLLHEGGYKEHSFTREGAFIYQSCSAPMRHGSFKGHLKFATGSLSGGGEDFDVRVAPFVLDAKPAFLY